MNELVKWPDARLRQRAEPVGEITDEVRSVVGDIRRAMETYGAVGLRPGLPPRLVLMFVLDIQILRICSTERYPPFQEEKRDIWMYKINRRATLSSFILLLAHIQVTTGHKNRCSKPSTARKALGKGNDPCLELYSCIRPTSLVFCHGLGSSPGLSACHVGVPLRIIVIELEGNSQVYINPKLSTPSPKKVSMEEGSISLPGERAIIERPDAITVEALGLDGKPFERRLEGWEARILMHENDQLNGVFFLDRVPKKGRSK